MKKLKFLILGVLLFILFDALKINTLGAESENADYLTYEEIIMSSGKLIKYFTQAEKDEISDEFSWHFFGLSIVPVNQAVHATYIASIKECMENRGSTPITISVDYSVETNNKVSFSHSGTISGGASGSISKIKADVSAKTSVEYSKSSSQSIKEKRTLDIIVEPNSQYMVVTKGTLNVTNGMLASYSFGIKMGEGCYEFVTLESQYAALEKRLIEE